MSRKEKNPPYLKEDGKLYKVCTKCGEEKLTIDFVVDKRKKSGFSASCKSCERARLTKYRLENAESVNEKARNYYHNNIEYYREKKKESYEKNKTNWINTRKKWVQNNSDRVKAIHRRYAQGNPHKIKAKTIKRRTLINKLPNIFSSDDLLNIQDFFNHRCPLSGSEDIHVDHFVALSTGHCGTYLGNVILLDSSLNSSKGNKNPFEWIKTREGVEQDRFVSLVKYLAEQNCLTPEEYKEFVYWCYRNKRKYDEINDEISIDVWRRKNG